MLIIDLFKKDGFVLPKAVQLSLNQQGIPQVFGSNGNFAGSPILPTCGSNIQSYPPIPIGNRARHWQGPVQASFQLSALNGGGLSEKGQVIAELVDFDVGAKRNFLETVPGIPQQEIGDLVKGLGDMFEFVEPRGMDAVLVKGNLDGLARTLTVQF